MDEPDEEPEAIERDYRRKVWLYAVLGALVILWGIGKLLSVHFALQAMW